MNIISVSKSVIFILLSFCVTSVQGEARSQFVGFSNDKVDGAAGIFEMQKACDAFIAKSHVCNTTEVAHSTHKKGTDYNLDSDTEAWILVDIQSLGNKSAISQFGLVSFTEEDKTLDCHGWSTNKSGPSNENEGATVTKEGRFKNTTTCQYAKSVACCK